MYNPLLKPVLAGIGIGLLIVALPFFLIKAALVFLLFGALFRFVARRLYWSRGYASVSGYGPRRRHHRRYAQRGYDAFGAVWHPALADTIRSMSDEDYGTFRQKLSGESSTNQPTTIEIQ